MKSANKIAGGGVASALVITLIVTACGGGGTSPAVSTSPVTSTAAKLVYSIGKIVGFGSIRVADTEFNDDVATINDEDGTTLDHTALRLGAVVEVKAGEFSESNKVKTSTAQNIMLTSLIRGPVDSIDVNNIVVLGQTVKVTSSTVFDDSLIGGLSAVKVGAIVRIYGTLDAGTGFYTATRIEPQSGAESYRLRGLVKTYNLDAKTISIGNAVIDVSSVTLPVDFKSGDLVRVKLQTTKNASGAYVALSVETGLYKPQENDHTEVDGIINDFTSSAKFSIEGLPVDASNAAFPDGTTLLAKGVRVEVDGAIVGGILVAKVVELRNDSDDQRHGLEIDGSILTLDTAKMTLTIRGVNIDYSSTSVVFTGGTAADLKVGTKVEVAGALGGDGVTVVATSIKIKP